MKEFINTVVHGDCFDILPKIEDNSIDLVVTDPPYGLTEAGNMERFVNGVPTVDQWEWDNFEDEEYEKFSERYIKEIARVLKPGRWAYIWCGDLMPGLLWRIGRKYGLKGKCQIIARKRNAAPSWRKINWRICFETSMAFSKGSSSTKNFHFLGHREMEALQDCIISDDQRVIEMDFPMGKKVTVHPTEKPEIVIIRQVMAGSDPGDLVLDPFSGSGTVAVVAKRLGRRFIAIEREEKYVDVSRARLAQGVLFSGEHFMPKAGAEEAFLWKE